MINDEPQDDRGVAQAESENEHGSLARKLGYLVEKGHSTSSALFSMHPYHVFFDGGLIAIAGFAFVFGAFVQPFEVLRFLAAFVVATLSFELGYVPFKARVIGIGSRSYLQDLLVFVLPVWIGVAVLLGVDVATTLDLIGLQLPLLLAFIRVGCFFGGCCYGIPSRYGVRYPPAVFEPHDGTCQSFSPGDDPAQPVFPIQLVESLVNVVLFGALLFRVVESGVDGLTLPLYLLLYAGYRFVSDFGREASARPNWGPLSEAQWVSLGIILVVASMVFAGLLPAW